ncbi:hypothetical protein IMG5_127370 [Ichthyophthirius multifiliis]|uniref:Protein YIF1 n=1 Tax=Ichthyophthirius multifiliis TaxID=5932 RepID=G0QVW8_ICHMU|nr:hypothetical protein IMG5_127370 [Ichthyophthirius multifiliis]EGR30633.1 hypothetical protein IMG5_127370 [Ichthyophthirius multifiliis]|eukprot:XP_004032220.1 hypothetical protein IMG5_127370 [Ichthyophthirius multifiliis]
MQQYSNNFNKQQQNQFNPNNFIDQFQSNMSTVKNIGTIIGGGDKINNLIDKTLQRDWLGEKIFNENVRAYFDVDNIYVLKKLKIILAPFLYRGEWISQNDYTDNNGISQSNSPKENIHAPDLYIPLMGLITFVLVSCLSAGIGENFKPEIIQINTSFCLLITFLEIFLFKFLFYLVNITNVTILNMMSHLSYRYISLTLVMISNIIIGGWITAFLMIYLLGSSIFFVFKTLRRYMNTLSDNFGIIYIYKYICLFLKDK